MKGSWGKREHEAHKEERDAVSAARWITKDIHSLP